MNVKKKKFNCVEDIISATGIKIYELERRFWANVNRDGMLNCWNWNRSIGSHGYGQMTIGGIVFTAHRLCVMIATCPIPEGKLVCHKCDNRTCVNPSHLYIGTYKDNINDAIERKRNLVGTKNGQSKLSDEKVISIRKEYSEGVSDKILATKYGVSVATVNDAISRRTWSHLN